MKAAPAEQAKLEPVQESDTLLAQIAHRRRSLPEFAALEDLAAQVRETHADLVRATAVLSDTKREVLRTDQAVEQVRSRLDRDTARLNSGEGSAKDLQVLQREVESLTSRQTVLEDEELEAMQAHEEASHALESAQTRVDELQARVAETEAARDEALKKLDLEESNVVARRNESAAAVLPDLLALYEKIRSKSDGVGAGRLNGNRCEACRMQLSPADMADLQAKAADDIVRCEECGRILIRDAQ